MTGNGVAIVTEGTSHALREAWRISPHLPHTAFETHLIYPGNPPLIRIEHGTRFHYVIAADDAESAGNVTGLPIKTPEQQGSFDQPFERRMALHCGRQSRMGPDHIPLTNQDLKLLH